MSEVVSQDYPLPQGMARPSVDVTDMAELARLLLLDRGVPKDLEKLFWTFLDPEFALSNLTPEDISRIMLYYDDARLAYLMSQPFYKHTFENDMVLTQIWAKLFVKLKRSGLGFERRMLATQITQNTAIVQAHQQPGRLARLFGRK